MFYLNPQVLYAIPVAAILATLLVLFEYARALSVQRSFGDWRYISTTSQPISRPRYLARALFAALAAALLIVALARPVIMQGTRSIAQGTVSVVAVVDVSRSMAAMDYDGKVPPSAVARRSVETGKITGQKTGVDDTGTRLEMVRHVMLDYMLGALSGNQLGIVSYAGQAFPQAFLTRDTAALRWVVDRGLTISSAPGEGSAMGRALDLAVAILDADTPADQERVIVLFSDGGNDDEASVLADFTREARLRHITVLVVAMGNVMPAKIPLSKLASDDDVAAGLIASGKRWYEVNGQIEKTGLNLQLLQTLASQAGGQFIHLQDMSQLNLLDYVGKPAKVDVQGTQQLFPWALLAALVSMVLAFASTHQWRRKTS